MDFFRNHERNRYYYYWYYRIPILIRSLSDQLYPKACVLPMTLDNVSCQCPSTMCLVSVSDYSSNGPSLNYNLEWHASTTCRVSSADNSLSVVTTVSACLFVEKLISHWLKNWWQIESVQTEWWVIVEWHFICFSRVLHNICLVHYTSWKQLLYMKQTAVMSVSASC